MKLHFQEKFQKLDFDRHLQRLYAEFASTQIYHLESLQHSSMSLQDEIEKLIRYAIFLPLRLITHLLLAFSCVLLRNQRDGCLSIVHYLKKALERKSYFSRSMCI